jgi:hypothetical protein
VTLEGLPYRGGIIVGPTRAALIGVDEWLCDFIVECNEVSTCAALLHGYAGSFKCQQPSFIEWLYKLKNAIILYGS